MKHMRVALAIFMLTVWSGVTADEPKPVDANVAKIAISRAGEITLNGREATIDEVRAALAKLSESKGIVWYYREGADEEEPHQAGFFGCRTAGRNYEAAIAHAV